MYNAPRYAKNSFVFNQSAATIIGATDSVVWALDRVTFRRMLMENASKKRRMYERFLEEVSLFVSLEPYERQKIADALEPVSFNDGEHVLIQGDVGESFFIVESGEAKVVQKDEHGVEHEFPSIVKGGYFGGKFITIHIYQKRTCSFKQRASKSINYCKRKIKVRNYE